MIGVWASASRQKATVRLAGGQLVETGPFVQVSRLGNPLINEVIVAMGDKDLWNSLPPSADQQSLSYVQHPEVAKLLPVLYPGVFPYLAGLSAARADLVAILLTGIPPGIISGFQNFTGATPADMLRLNMAIPPAATPDIFGILGGDLAGFPNGRRVADDVVAIELRAIAGVTYPLVNPSFKADAAASVITDGAIPARNPIPFLPAFPYLGVPANGFDTNAPLAIVTTAAGADGEPGPAADLSRGVLLDIGGDTAPWSFTPPRPCWEGRPRSAWPGRAPSGCTPWSTSSGAGDGGSLQPSSRPWVRADYVLWDGESMLGRVKITGGQATEVAWPPTARDDQ